MKLKNTITGLAAASLLGLGMSAQALPMYFDVGVTGSSGDTGIYDPDLLSGVFDMMAFSLANANKDINGNIVANSVVDGQITLLSDQGTTIFDTEGLTFGLTQLLVDWNWDGSNGSVNIDYQGTGASRQDVADITLTDFNMNGMKGYFTSVLDNFWYLDNGNGIAGDASDTAITNSFLAGLAIHFDASNTTVDVTVPEPSILALMGLGLLGFGFAGRRRNAG